MLKGNLYKKEKITTTYFGKLIIDICRIYGRSRKTELE